MGESFLTPPAEQKGMLYTSSPGLATVAGRRIASSRQQYRWCLNNMSQYYTADFHLLNGRRTSGSLASTLDELDGHAHPIMDWVTQAVHEQPAAGSKRPVNAVPGLNTPQSGLAVVFPNLGTDVLPANAPPS